MNCNAITKNGGSCKRKAVEHGMCRQHGEGFFNTVQTIGKKVLTATPFSRRLYYAANGKRGHATQRLNEFLDEHKGVPIKKLWVTQKPILTPVHTALNALSFGGFSKAASKLGYDGVYHDALVIELENGQLWKVEKNHVVEGSKATKSDLRNQHWEIPVPKNVDMRTLIDTGATGQERQFFDYRAGSDNCQRFCHDVVTKNGMAYPKQIQNAATLLDTLPGGHVIPNAVTDIASIGDRFVHGDGLKYLNLRQKIARKK